MVTPIYRGPVRPPFITAETIDISQVQLNDVPAGVALRRFDTVYLDGSYARLSNSYSLATTPAAGLVDSSPASGVAADVIIRGLVSNADWSFSSGNIIFLGSGGGLVQSAPTTSGLAIQRMGVALTQTSIRFEPEPALRLIVS